LISSVPYCPATWRLPLASKLVSALATTLMLATRVIAALSAPSVSAPAAPLVVPAPVTTLPVWATKVLAGTASLSARAVGPSSVTLMVRFEEATSPWRAVSPKAKG
jgi:hypothetical protein